MLKIGHRGAPGRPRNRDEDTINSFERALDAGVDGIEFDVRRSREGVWFLHHGYFSAIRYIGGISWKKLSRKRKLNTLAECLAWLEKKSISPNF